MSNTPRQVKSSMSQIVVYIAYIFKSNLLYCKEFVAKAMKKLPRKVGRGRYGPAVANEQFNNVVIALRRIIRSTDLHSKHLAKTFGLTTPQVYVLKAINDLGKVTTGQISDYVNLSQATVTTILDRLENRSLVERHRNLGDRRVVHARLTPKGRAVLKKAPPLLHERFIADFACLRRADQERIVGTLNEVADMMGARDCEVAPVLAVELPTSGDRT